nr:leucine-rich repeat domain-containing protein [Prevotella sp.]
MKKKILLSMILLALCLIQASADTYYFKINLYKDNGELAGWSKYIKVSHSSQQGDWVNGLRELVAGKPVTDEGDGNGNGTTTYQLPKTNKGEVDLDRIYGIVFANGKGRKLSQDVKIMEGGEYAAWEKIRPHIKYLELREYELDTYTGDTYFGNMNKVEKLELPQGGMTVGNGDNIRYFANADNLKEITIWNGSASVDITEYEGPVLRNCVGEHMFSNCYSLSTKYINRLIRNVTEIKYRAFYAGDEHRGDFSDEVAGHNMAIEIPSSVTKIGSQAFYNRVKVTGLNIHGKDCLEIGSEAFGQCDELAKITLDNITPDNKELKIYKNAFMRCKQLNAFENMNTAKITYLGTGVFGDCRSMTDKFVNGVLQNYADNGGTKIPAYLFFGCNGQDGHDGTVANKNKCAFTNLIIPAQFSEIGDGAFAFEDNDAKIRLKTITVNSEKAPKCLDNSGETDEYANIRNKKVFDGLDPNLTTVIFKNAAEGWEKTETTGFLTYMTDNSEFQRLLTKDIYSDHTAYINVPQQHAIVRLHRTLKEGWNTICLPFGVNYRYCSKWGEPYKTKQDYNASIIVNGLTHSTGVTSDNFTMGVYRGYWEEGKTFMFLHYTDFDRYPLDFCETFLVKMRKQDIDNAPKDDKKVAIYTFRNVDLNYRWTATGESGNDGTWKEETYTAEEMPQQVKPFYGNENKTEIPFKGNASYNKYVLKGSLVQLTGTVEDGIITTNDYFFQQTQDGKMKLYPYTKGNKYGIRGFSGWFHYELKTSPSKPSELSLSLFDDGSTTPIETVKVDDLNRDTSGKVYSISGVLMKNNAADLNNLPKGIYVVNGKKYVVK